MNLELFQLSLAIENVKQTENTLNFHSFSAKTVSRFNSFPFQAISISIPQTQSQDAPKSPASSKSFVRIKDGSYQWTHHEINNLPHNDKYNNDDINNDKKLIIIRMSNMIRTIIMIGIRVNIVI